MKKSKKSKILKIVLIIIVSLIILSVLGGLIYYFVTTKDANLSTEKLPINYQNIQIYDRENNDITSLYYSNFVLQKDITDNIKTAFLTTEDRKFYSHHGINYKRILGAMVNNIIKGDLAEGGSTITQQLIKNTHLSQDKNIDRKLKEMKIAKQLENYYTKDEILEMYLNILYFGGGIYGLNNAAYSFFGKTPEELNLAECSMLAGVVKNPSKYSPIVNFDNANKRKELILRLIRNENLIDDNEYYEQLNYPIEIKNYKPNNYLNSYCTNAIYEVKQLLGLKASEKLPNGVKIYTNLDINMQKHIDNIVSTKQGTTQNDNGKFPDNAIILLDNYNNGVMAFSSNYKQSQYNIYRQTGSVAKPFVSYLPAFEHGLINVATPILDEKIDINGYSPENFKNVYHGYVNTRESLAHSYNIPSVKVLDMLGVDNAKKFLNKINWKTSNLDGLSMALGGFTNGNTLTEVAGAYSMLANLGEYSKPRFVNKVIVDNKTYSNTNVRHKVASSGNAYIITDCLKSTVKDGTLRKLSYFPYEIAGKTGTVAYKNGNSDSYSASYTTEHTLVVWQGNLENSTENILPNKNMGGSYPTNQAYLVYEKLYSDHKPSDFVIPNDVVEEEIDTYTLENEHKVVKANPLFPENMKKWEIFTIDNMPNEYSTIFNDCNIKNVLVDYDYDKITLSFDAKKFLNYEIYKVNLLSTTLLDTISDQNGIFEYIDKNNNGIIKYRYMIKPYFMYNDTKIYLKPKYVSIK